MLPCFIVMVHGERPNCAVEIRWAVEEWCSMYVYVYICREREYVESEREICDTMGI